MTEVLTIRAVDVGKSTADILSDVLPEVFDRFKEAAARSSDLKKGVDALFQCREPSGLPSVFSSLGLLRDERGKTVFRVESGPLAEVLSRIEERANYGDTASGRFLRRNSRRKPFGWDFEAVRLLVLALLRAGKFKPPARGRQSTPRQELKRAILFQITTFSDRHLSAQRKALNSLNL